MRPCGLALIREVFLFRLDGSHYSITPVLTVSSGSWKKGGATPTKLPPTAWPPSTQRPRRGTSSACSTWSRRPTSLCAAGLTMGQPLLILQQPADRWVWLAEQCGGMEPRCTDRCVSLGNPVTFCIGSPHQISIGSPHQISVPMPLACESPLTCLPTKRNMCCLVC